MDFLAMKLQAHGASCTVALSWWWIHLSARILVFSTKQIPTLNSSAVSLPPNLESEHIKVHTLSTFASVLYVFVCAFSHPLLDHLCPSKTLDFFIAFLPLASVNKADMSLVLLAVFTQKLMFIHCSRFLLPISAPTVYHRRVLLPLLPGNEWLTHFVCSSCKLKLELVQTCLDTWVFLSIKTAMVIIAPET
jgi:hypothetical protein